MDLDNEDNSDNEPCLEQLDMIVEDASDDGESSEEDDDGDTHAENHEADDIDDVEDENEEKRKINKTIPENSKIKYESAYSQFLEWQREKKFNSFSEKVMLVYFFELSKKRKSTTLWNTYSMLKCTLGSFHKVDIGEYKRLLQFLKRKGVGCKKRKSKEFTAAEVTKFLNTASDEEFLLEKVLLIVGICGATRRAEICKLTIDNVIDTGSKFVMTIQHVIKNIPARRFSIEDDFYTLVKKYVSLRPVAKVPSQKMTNRFFLNYQKLKCTRQVIGINKIGGTPKRIAQFLKLSDANQYTGHCFRRTTEKLLKDVGVDMRSLSRYGEWKSCHVTLDDMNKIFSWITSRIKLKLLPVSPKPVKKISKPKPKVVNQTATDKPIIETLDTDQLKIDNSISNEPIIEKTGANQSINQPIIDQSITEPPVVDEPIIDQAVTDEPMNDRPVLEEPITDQPSIDEPIADEPFIIQPIKASTSKTRSQTVPASFPKVIQPQNKINRIDFHTYKYSVVEIDRRRFEIVARGWTPLEGTQTVTSLGGFNDYQSAVDWAEILDRRKTLDKQNWEFLQKHLESANIETMNVDHIKEELFKEEMSDEDEMCL